jgi:hypothetical protein
MRPPTVLPPPCLLRVVAAEGIPYRTNGDAWWKRIGPRQAAVEAKAEAAKREAVRKAIARDAPPDVAEKEGLNAAANVVAMAKDQIAAVPAGGDGWKRYGVDWPRDIAPLRPPPPDSVLLDQQVLVPSGWMLDVLFPQESEPDPVSFQSEHYPRPGDGEPLWGHRVGVTQYGEFALHWARTQPPAVGAYVAISFEGFAPGRDSSDYIVQVTPGRMFRNPGS